MKVSVAQITLTVMTVTVFSCPVHIVRTRNDGFSSSVLWTGICSGLIDSTADLAEKRLWGE